LGHHRCAKWILVLASLYFYAFFNVHYLPIILSSVVINYCIGLILSNKTLIHSSLLPPPTTSQEDCINHWFTL
jgi:hypothetical protein